jgi:hypothetical protein
MSPHAIPLNELAVAVQSAVEEVLGKHGAVPIEKLWVGFVAPDALANEEAAGRQACCTVGQGKWRARATIRSAISRFCRSRWARRGRCQASASEADHRLDVFARR